MPIPYGPPLPPNRALKAILPRLERRARRLTRTAADAEDLSQDCALKVWAHLQRGAPIEDLEAYAMTVLRHQNASTWRKAVDTDELEESSATTPPDSMPRLVLQDLMRLMEELPSEQVDVLRHVLEGETSPARIAEQLGVPKGTVMSRLARARAKLRENVPDWQEFRQ